MAVHDKFRALAKKLIDKHGREIVLIRSSSTPADSQKPWRGSDEPASGPAADDGTEVTATGVFLEVTERDEPFLLIKRGATALLVAPSDMVTEQDVTQFEAVRDGNAETATTWHIVAAHVIAPGTQEILYTFEVES